MKPIYLERAQVPPHLLGAYRGTSIRVYLCETLTIPATAGTWSDGTRAIYEALRLQDGARQSIVDTFSSPWDADRVNRIVTLKPGFAILETGSFCGKDAGLTFHMLPTDAAPLLPPPAPELTREERALLMVTHDLISSARDDELRRSGLPNRASPAMTAAKITLQSLGLLATNGSITPKGRNVRSTLKEERFHNF